MFKTTYPCQQYMQKSSHTNRSLILRIVITASGVIERCQRRIWQSVKHL